MPERGGSGKRECLSARRLEGRRRRGTAAAERRGGGESTGGGGGEDGQRGKGYETVPEAMRERVRGGGHRESVRKVKVRNRRGKRAVGVQLTNIDGGTWRTERKRASGDVGRCEKGRTVVAIARRAEGRVAIARRNGAGGGEAVGIQLTNIDGVRGTRKGGGVRQEIDIGDEKG